MSEFVKTFLKDNTEQLKRFKDYIKDNNWTDKKDVSDKESEYKVHAGICTTVLKRLEYFVKKAEGDLHLKTTRKALNLMTELIDVHTDRVDFYLSSFDITKLDQARIKTQEIDLQAKLFKDVSTLKDKINALNIQEDKKDLSGITFYDEQKVPLSMHHIISEMYPDIKKKVEAMKIDFDSPPDNEFLIHKKNVPEWNDDKHYFEQDKKTLQFWVDEYKKIQRGIEIDGVYIHPWLYFHLNVFKTYIPVAHENKFTGRIENKDILMHPPLRDNEWYVIQESYSNAEKEQMMLFIAASRRLFKSTGLASHFHWKALTGGKELVLAGGSAKDLGQVEKNFKNSIQNADGAFRLINLTNDWSGKVEFGIRKKSKQKIPQCILNVVNLNHGGDKSSEILAGYTPDAFAIDEIMKAPFIEQLDAAKPSFDSPHGKRLTPILSGCVCAGTKVWNNKGDLINIENVDVKEGILGFDVKEQKVSKEDITYWKKPHNKDCYRIETNTGRFLECSDDHPILVRQRNFFIGRKRRLDFIEAKNLKNGDHICISDEHIPFGTEKMWNPRLVGLLIGDGNYSYNRSVRIANCDKEINDYIYQNFNAVFQKGHKTKDGRDYMETGIRGIRPELKKLGILNQKKDTKTLPKKIHSYQKSDICEMIGGFFDADGHVVNDGKNYTINLSSGHKSILLEVQLLLQKLNIHGGIYHKKPNTNNPKTPNDSNGCYVFTIADRKSIINFYKNIKFLVKYKQEKLSDCYNSLIPRKNKIDKNYPNMRIERVVSVEYIGIKKVYNLTANNTNTYIANGIITHNTGGNASLSEDALIVLADPKNNDILPMDWELLESKLNKEDITWKRSTFGTFAPAQMSAKEGMIKKEMPLWEYLKVKKTEALDKINIKVTDWPKCNEIIQRDREKLRKNRKSFIKEIVYYPIDPEEIFQSGNVNPFPVEEAKRHRNKIKEAGDIGRYVNIFRNGNKVEYELSNKELPDFPHKGGFIDCPVMLFEDIPLEEPPYGLYCAGLDDYKQERSDGDSLGSIYIFKRQLINDRYGYRIAASLTTRPNPHKKFHRDIHTLLDGFNAMCLMENADIGFKEYLDTRYLTERYLQKSFQMSGDISISNSGNRTYGLSPTANKKSVVGAVVKYCNERHKVYNEKGEVEEVLGVELINDLGLLDEIIKYNENGNFDRITAFGHALIQDHYLTSNYITFMDEPKEKKKENPNKRTKKIHPMFGNRTGKMF